MDKEYLLLGYVTDAFSLDGTLKILSKTDFAEIRYQEGNEIFLFDEKNNQTITMHVVSFRNTGLFDFVKLKEVTTKEQAEALKGYEVQALKDYSSLKKGTYYYVDLVGCKVSDEKGQILGEVKNVEEYPAQITLRVKRAGKEDFFVPFIKAFIKKVDVENKLIKINVIEGML